MTDPAGHCWHCGHALAATDYAREGECPQCRHQTHVCRNCRFYQPGKYNDCQEPVAEAVTDKTRANFCDYFSPNPSLTTTAAPDDTAEDLLDAAEALFKSPDS